MNSRSTESPGHCERTCSAGVLKLLLSCSLHGRAKFGCSSIPRCSRPVQSLACGEIYPLLHAYNQKIVANLIDEESAVKSNQEN